MKTGIKKLIIRSLTALVVMLLLATTAVVWLYWHGVKQNNKIQDVNGITRLPGGDVQLGEPVTFSVLLQCPWHRRPTEAAVELGKGICMTAEPVIARAGWRLGYSLWRVNVTAKPYRTGNIPPGKLEIKFNRYNEYTSDIGMNFRIPELNVLPLNNASSFELQVAGKIPEPGIASKKWYWITGIILGLLLFILWLYRRRNSVTQVITPWAAALLELAELRNSFRNGKTRPEICFVQLTDIVRQYLENRFHLHAPRQTTSEFLDELNQPSGILPEPHRPFLREFMTAADLVKFARLDPDEHLLSAALEKAETLIIETKPAESDGGKK